MIPIYRTPRDIALKLFREAGRTWKATDLRDWVMQTKQIAQIDPSQESVVAIGLNGQPIAGSMRMKDLYQIRRPGGELVDLTMFFFETCRAWEEYFLANPDLGKPYPPTSSSLLSIADS